MGQTLRQQFERWHYRNAGFAVACWRSKGGGYSLPEVQWRWEAWTAAAKAQRRRQG